MNIKTFLDILVGIDLIVIFLIFIIELVSFNKNITKQVNELYNYSVQNEYDKQDIYKRLANLELEKERGNNG